MPNIQYKYDNGMNTVQTLGQKWSAKEKRIAEYACNRYANVLVSLDIEIERCKLLGEECGLLENFRKKVLLAGTALYIQSSDVISQLSIRVGRTGSREPIDASKF
jgi:hypothetical protein